MSRVLLYDAFALDSLLPLFFWHPHLPLGLTACCMQFFKARNLSQRVGAPTRSPQIPIHGASTAAAEEEEEEEEEDPDPV